MRVYLCGPMSGLPDLNVPAFRLAAARLRGAGLEVVSPVELCDGSELSWAGCMRLDLKGLCECDRVVLLPGWEASRGALLELHVARELGMEVRLVGELLGD